MEEVIELALGSLIEQIQDEVTGAISGVFKDKLKNFANAFNTSIKSDILSIDVDVLTKQKLVEIASKNRVADATEVAAYKAATEDSYIIYLAYTKDKDLISIDSNRYIIINSKFISREIDLLFKKDNLIILK